MTVRTSASLNSSPRATGTPLEPELAPAVFRCRAAAHVFEELSAAIKVTSNSSCSVEQSLQKRTLEKCLQCQASFKPSILASFGLHRSHESPCSSNIASANSYRDSP